MTARYMARKPMYVSQNQNNRVVSKLFGATESIWRSVHKALHDKNAHENNLCFRIICLTKTSVE